MIELSLKRVRLASGIELDTVDLGPADAPALVFLHGFPESHRTWRHQIAHFSDRFRCIAPDQRGYRGSSKPQEPGEYTGDKLVGDVFQLADALGVGPFTIVGHDWGGAIAWGVAAAGQLNGRVRRAVIANAPHPTIFQRLVWTDPRQRAASQYIRTLRDRANDNAIRRHGLTGVLLKAFGSGIMPRMEPEERADLLAGWKDPDAAIAMLNWYRASRIEVPPAEAPYEAPTSALGSFPKASCPTLVIWALNDVALPPANLEGLHEYVEDLTFVEVPDSGHFVPWEAPDAVNRAMEAFLSKPN